MKKILIALILLFSLPAHADKLLKNMIRQVEQVNHSYQPIINFAVEGKAYIISPKAFEGKDVISLLLYDARKSNADPESATAAAVFLRDSHGRVKLFTLVLGEGQDILREEIVLIFQLNRR